MRTTLNIDDDILAAARAMAEQQHRSIGDVVSELVRTALYRPQAAADRNGIPLLPVRKPAAVVGLDLVSALRDEQP